MCESRHKQARAGKGKRPGAPDFWSAPRALPQRADACLHTAPAQQGHCHAGRLAARRACHSAGGHPTTTACHGQAARHSSAPPSQADTEMLHVVAETLRPSSLSPKPSSAVLDTVRRAPRPARFRLWHAPRCWISAMRPDSLCQGGWLSAARNLQTEQTATYTFVGCCSIRNSRHRQTLHTILLCSTCWKSYACNSIYIAHMC